MTWIANISGNYYLYKSIKVNGRRTTKVIERYGKERPKFYLPLVLRGYCEDILKNLPEKSVDLIIDDPLTELPTALGILNPIGIFW